MENINRSSDAKNMFIQGFIQNRIAKGFQDVSMCFQPSTWIHDDPLGSILEFRDGERRLYFPTAAQLHSKLEEISMQRFRLWTEEGMTSWMLHDTVGDL